MGMQVQRSAAYYANEFGDLRRKAGPLSPAQRDFVLDAIAAAERQQEDLRRSAADVAGLNAELSLIVSAAKFNAWAAGLA